MAISGHHVLRAASATWRHSSEVLREGGLGNVLQAAGFPSTERLGPHSEAKMMQKDQNDASTISIPPFYRISDECTYLHTNSVRSVRFPVLPMGLAPILGALLTRGPLLVGEFHRCRSVGRRG